MMPDLPDWATPLTPDAQDTGPPPDLSTPTAFAIEAIRADERDRIKRVVDAMPRWTPVGHEEMEVADDGGYLRAEWVLALLGGVS